jgi:hypothetical protein
MDQKSHTKPSTAESENLGRRRLAALDVDETGVLAAHVVPAEFNKTEYTIRGRSENGPELFAWSISPHGVEYVTFTGAMICCNKGRETVTLSDLSGKPVFEKSAQPDPVISDPATAPKV